MSHTVHPYSHRLGIIRDWKSRWFGSGDQYRRFLKADVTLRAYLDKRLKGLYVSDVEIERGEKTMRLIIKTSRPGMLIGRNGEGSEKLRKDLLALMDKKKLEKPKDFKIDIEEVRSPESNAKIVSYMITEGLVKRMPYRRVLKQSVEKVMANRDVLGVRMVISGRLGGADIARTEELKKGRVPLQTFRADIDYAEERAIMPYGTIGIKVWIYKGDIFDKDKNVR
ncbi:MAG TPA: 30S ribosomal protein S3 [Candidatus Paceibacterota bacterium]|nr:30S ribosomal protein S3 [Candidatus Paceibacterota bacterium]